MKKAAAPEGLLPDTPAQEAARRWFAWRVAEVQRQAGRAAHACEPGPVHDLRVSLRRLRAAVALFGKRDVRRLESALAKTQKTAGALRELHVGRELRERLGAGGRPEDEHTRLLDKHARKLSLSLAKLNSKTLPMLTRAMEAQELAGKLAGHRLRARLAKLVVTCESRLDDARTLEPKAAHALRISLKKLRYTAELLVPAFPAAMQALIAALVPLQDGLGALHDLDVLLELAEGPLRADAQRERAALVATLGKQLAEWTRSGRLSAMRRAL